MAWNPRICGIALACCLWLCACGQEDVTGSPWGGPCAGTSDCAPGLVCRGNLCSIDATDGDEDTRSDAVDKDPDMDNRDAVLTEDADNDGGLQDNEYYGVDEEEQADFRPDEIHLTFWVYTNPVLQDIPVMLRYASADNPYFGDEYSLDQNDPFDYGIMDAMEGNFVFSAPGYRDVVIHRDAIIDYANSLAQHSLGIEVNLQTAAATPAYYSDAPTGSIDWRGYRVIPGRGVFSIPTIRIMKDLQNVFEAFGSVIGIGPDGLLYWARYRGNTANADFATLDEDLHVDVIAHESLCYPVYADTRFVPGAVMLMTGCHWKYPSGSGMYTRYEYGSRVMEELGRMDRDPSKAFKTISQGRVVQGGGSCFIYDGKTVFSDDRWLEHFEAFLHNGSVVLTSGYDGCDNQNYYTTAYRLRACSVHDGGDCSDLGRILQYSVYYDERAGLDDLAYDSYNDGSVLKFTTFLDNEYASQYQCGTGPRVLMVMPLDDQAHFGNPVTFSLEDESRVDPVAIPAVDPTGQWLALHVMENAVSTVGRLYIYDISNGEQRYDIPGVVTTVAHFPSQYDNRWNSPLIFSDANTLLYIAINPACHDGLCGNLMALDIATGQQRHIEPRARSFTLLDDNSLLVARQCYDQAFCRFDDSSVQNRAVLVEHVPSLASPEQRDDVWFAFTGECMYSDEAFSYCPMFRDPFVNGIGDPWMVHLDYRPGRALFTHNLSLSDIAANIPYASYMSEDDCTLYSTHRNGNSTRYARHAYAIDTPGNIEDFGCSTWLTPIHRAPHAVIEGAILSNSMEFGVIPLDAATAEYRFQGILYKIGTEPEVITYSCRVWSGGPEKEYFELDIPRLLDTLAPMETCN